MTITQVAVIGAGSMGSGIAAIAVVSIATGVIKVDWLSNIVTAVALLAAIAFESRLHVETVTDSSPMTRPPPMVARVWRSTLIAFLPKAF